MRDFHRMDAEPHLEASHTSERRLAGFALTASGALVVGIGSLLTWVTVGIADQGNAQTVSPGTDLAGGLITLVCAVVVLVLALVSRAVGDAIRRIVSMVVIAAGAFAAALATYFISAAPSHYSPVDDDKLVDAIATATGRSVEEVRIALAQVIDTLGGYTHVGPGPWVVIVGGVLVIAGGVLTLRWAQRRRPNEGAGLPAPWDERAAE
jgi:Tryptophan-associated transmembrane protein (Trp_oprn_chp)